MPQAFAREEPVSGHAPEPPAEEPDEAVLGRVSGSEVGVASLGRQRLPARRSSHQAGLSQPRARADQADGAVSLGLPGAKGPEPSGPQVRNPAGGRHEVVQDPDAGDSRFPRKAALLHGPGKLRDVGPAR